MIRIDNILISETSRFAAPTFYFGRDGLSKAFSKARN